MFILQVQSGFEKQKAHSTGKLVPKSNGKWGKSDFTKVGPGSLLSKTTAKSTA